MEDDTASVKRDEAHINGRTNGPFGSDDADADRPASDNKHSYDQENSANGLDSEQVRGGQDGRNNRGIGSTDMDSQNGVLRMGDQSNSTMEVTEAGAESAAADSDKTSTAMVDVTTAGPDDYASADQVDTPKAQEAAKQQPDGEEEQNSSDETQAQEDIAQTGTDLSNQPTY